RCAVSAGALVKLSLPIFETLCERVTGVVERIYNFVAVSWSRVGRGARRRPATTGCSEARNRQEQDDEFSYRFNVGANIHTPHFAGPEGKTKATGAKSTVSDTLQCVVVLINPRPNRNGSTN